MIFTYDGTAKSQADFLKNVYKGYLSSAEKRSMPEKLFEQLQSKRIVMILSFITYNK